MTEQVLSIPTKSLHLKGYKPLRRMNEEQLKAWLNIYKKDFILLPRSEAETNYNFKHLINYCFLYKTSEDFNKTNIEDNTSTNYFTYERTKKGNESRLHNNLSIGVGGHIGEIIRTDTLEGIKGYLREEVMSEVEINNQVDGSTHQLAGVLSTIHQSFSYTYQTIDSTGQFYGLLNDDSNDVGKVHLGLVWGVSLQSGDEVEVREDKLIAKGFWSKDKLLSNLSQFESWSQLLIESFE